MSVLLISRNREMEATFKRIAIDLNRSLVVRHEPDEALGEALSDNKPFLLVFVDIDNNLNGQLSAMSQFIDAARRQNTPLIALVDTLDDEYTLECSRCADDVMCTAADESYLQARIDALLIRASNVRQLEAQRHSLDQNIHSTQREHEVVEQIFHTHFERNMIRSETVKVHISPVSVFNGDVYLSAVGPTGSIYIAVGDVTGHGLPAAVGAIPVYSMFQTMAGKGLGVGTIAYEMNKALLDLLPKNMMMAATLIEIDSVGEQFTIWSGGMPPVVIADEQGRLLRLLRPRHTPLAASASHEFNQSVGFYQLPPGSRIYLMTDGIEESTDADGNMFGEERLYGLFDGTTPLMFDRIIDELNHFTGGTQGDDITLIEITALPSNASVVQRHEDAPQVVLPWELHFTLTPELMRDTDPVPQITSQIKGTLGFDVHQDFISTILSELYGNALEHGLLGLDSNIKDTDDGFIMYYQLRQECLNQLDEGTIKITLKLVPTPDGGEVFIEVTDSGPGFDYEKKNQACEDDSFGRGIDIIRTVCRSFNYSNGGRTATAVYPIGSKTLGKDTLNFSAPP